MFNIADFKAVLSKKYITPSNKFQVRIPMPVGLQNGPYFPIVRDLEFWCEAVSIPGITLQTHNVSARYSYGPEEFRPYNVVMQPIECVFINDGLGDNWTFFQRWMGMIFNFNMSGGINATSGQISQGVGVEQKYTPYKLAYRDEYLTDIQIQIFNAEGLVVKNIMAREAFPYQMNISNMNWADNDTYSKIHVAFAFTDWFSIQEEQPLVDIA